MESKFKTDLTKRAFNFGIAVIRACERLPKNRVSFVVENQIIRCATSVGANLVESKASSTRKEFKKFNEIALKSANETRYWLEVISELDLLPEKNVDQLLMEVIEISCMLASGIKKLKSS